MPLRVEDVPLQTSASLFAAEREADGPLLDCIQRELAKRRVNALLFGDDGGGDEYEVSVPAAQEPPALLEAPTVTTSTTTAMVTAPVESVARPADRPLYGKSLLPPPAPLSPAPFTSFVTAQTNGAGGFKERARATARSRKMRALEQSEEHKQLLADKQREERRQAIVRRMEERRERRQRAEEAREKKRQMEQQRRAERARELEEEMERAAEIAKAEAESNGMSQEEAVASAAAAAASLIEQASCGIVDDSDSDGDITTATSAESSAHASSDTDSPDRKVSPSTSVVGSAANANISPPSLYLCDDESSGTSESSEHHDDDDDDEEEEDGIKGEGARKNLQESLPTSSSSSSLSSSSQLDQPSSPEVDNISSGQLLGEPSPASMSMDGDAPSVHTEDLGSDHLETLESSPATPSSPIPPPPASQRSFVSVYPHIWSLFTAFAQTNTASPLSPMACQSRKSKARPTEAIDALLEHQARINDEFLEAMEDYLELQATSTAISGDPPICPSSDRFVLINSGRPDVASLISDVLTTGYEGDGNDRVWHPIPTDLGLGFCFNLLWTWRQPQVDVQSLLLCQKINRFRGTQCLTRKDLLKKSIQKFSASARSSVRRIEIQGILPLTFVLPQEYNAFAAAFSAIQRIPGASQSNLWISKPIGSSRGRGISVINDIGDVSYSQPIVIQKYLMNPLRFHGYKFDLRLYVLVTAFSRLEAFVYSEGLARFASKPFSASADCIYDEQIHLTNSSIQKDYRLQNSHPVRMAGTAGGDNKTRMTWLFRRLEGQGGIDTKLLWCQIKELCLKTLQVVDGNIPPQPNSFEIFGFDVIITDELKPLLIEVNACPALARDSHLDADVKEALIRDTVALVDPPTIDRRALSRICKQRMGGQSGGSTLEEDLRVIFTGRLPRQIGELPRELGGYEVLTVP